MCAAPLLVNSLKSRQEAIYSKAHQVHGFTVWPSTVKILRGVSPRSSVNPRGDRAAITSFSDSSKRNLKFKAANSFPKLISQFCLTYHENFHQGRTIKQHLDNWLHDLRRNFPSVKYLWILEFQTRGFAHFHVFLNLPKDTPALHVHMAESWNRITGEGETHKAFHLHERNFITWEMGSGSYLTKYLDKEAQKSVPEGFEGVGRYWGCSRDLVPLPVVVEAGHLESMHQEQIDHQTGEVRRIDPARFIARALARWHEKKLAAFGAVSKVRTKYGNVQIHGAKALFWQMYSHFYFPYRGIEPNFVGGYA
jgi:hypothetical protein